MDNHLFLQHLHDLSLEEGRAYIQAHAAELTDHAAVGVLIRDEAKRQEHIAPFVALKLAELLIYFSEYAHHTPSHALGLQAKGDASLRIGDHQSALKFLDAAGEEFLRLGDEVDWANSRIGWICSAAWLGRVEEALQEAARAREAFLRYGEDYWACIIDHNTAVIYTQLGQYQKALDLYERMLAIYPTLTDQSEAFIKRAIAMARVNQARNLAWLGNFEQAYRLQQQAQESFIALEETSLIIHSEINLADLDYTQGYYGSALRRYYQARDTLIQNKGHDPMLLAELKLWMANCLVKLNRSQEACQLAAEAVEAYRDLSTSLSTSNALREYATTLVASGRSKEALVVLDEAWTLFNQGGFDHQATATKLQQAELLLEMRSAAEAYDQAHLIKEYFDRQGLVSRSVHASLVMAGALIEIAQGAGTQHEEEQQSWLVREAASLCEQVNRAARQHNLQEQVYKSQRLLGRLAVIQGNPARAARHYQAAIAQIERILDDLVYDLSPSFLHTTWTVYEDMIALCLEQKQDERAFSYLERARSMALRQYLNKSSAARHKGPSAAQARSAAVLRMQHELEAWQQRYHDYSAQLVNIDTSVSHVVDREVIQNELKRCEAKLSELFERLHLHELDTHITPHTAHPKNRGRTTLNAQQTDVVQLRQYLAPDQLLLAYFLYKGRLVIFAATTEHLVTHQNPDGVAQLQQLLPFLYARLDPDGWPDLQRPPHQSTRRMLNKLYDLLVAPVASLLPLPSGSLTIVPYGLLHKLPFHALYNGSHFLVEDFQISYLPASSILTRLNTDKQKSLAMDTEVFTRLPLIFGYSGNGHLQRVLEEAKTVAALLNGSCYLEEEATIARLIEEAPGSPIIHLATHGQSRLDAPNFSYVRLAGGQLNAIDAFSLNLEGCELVTLSGCETGLALSSGGDEQLGLGRAFLAAGASSLVMSLWPVEDQATSELMQLFYQRLLYGDSKVQALRSAQCSFLHHTSPIYTHPYFWAAFRLVGDVGPLMVFDTRKW